MDDVTQPNPLVFYLLETFQYPIVFMYGAIVGSFLNVLIYRLPLIWAEKWQIEQEKAKGGPDRLPGMTISGKSSCPRCRNELKPWHNVPILGFLFLRGRCAFCKTRISWRYFSVELLNACLWTALFYSLSPRNLVGWADFAFQALFASTLLAMVFIDLDHFIAPDELNLTAALLGLGRDLACLGLLFMLVRTENNPGLWAETAPRFLAFGWVPWAILGALTYGFVLFLVSLGSHLYYARPPWEPLGSAVRRYFTFADPPPPPPGYPLPEPEQVEPVEEEAEDTAPPARLGLPPGIMAFLSAALLIPAIGVFASLFFLVPLVAFLLIARRPGEPVSAPLRRFFSVDDQHGLPEDGLPVDAPPDEADLEARNMAMQLKEESDQFALEAETGQHGGMGIGDVKLAFGIGALLGPGMSLLSLFVATLLGAVIGSVVAGMQGRGVRTGVPFVPFMAAGAIIVMLFGQAIVSWYVNISGLNKQETALTRSTTPR